MKIRKKFAAMLLSVLMVLTLLPAGALADTTSGITSSTTGTLAITKERSQSTFTVYKILDMSAASGADAFTYTANSNFTSLFSQAGVPSIATLAGYTTTANATELASFISQVQNYMSGKGITGVSVTSVDTKTQVTDTDGSKAELFKATFSSLPIGYYLVTETQTTGAQVASKDFLVSVPQYDSSTSKWNYSVTATCKDGTPHFDKKIIKDSGDTGTLTATKNIGDNVEYRLTSDVPQYDPSADASKIVYNINDRLSKGLTFNDGDIHVYGITDPTNNTKTDLTGTSAYTFSKKALTSTDSVAPDGTELDLVFSYGAIKGFKQIKVFYTAQLNQKAVIGVPGNPNTPELDYSENPGGNTYPNTPTPPRVFTTGLAITKLDNSNGTTALPGAVFTVTNSQGKTVAVYTYDNPATNPKIHLNDAGLSQATDPNGNTYILGLNADTYTITETTAPTGYGVAAPITVKITANTDTSSGDYDGTFSYNLSSDPVGTLPHLAAFKGLDNSILIGLTFKDDKGFVLPGTGGIGTTIFFVSGIAILLLGGCLAFVYTRKKRTGSHFQH